MIHDLAREDQCFTQMLFLSKNSKTYLTYSYPYRDQMFGELRWCVFSLTWASKYRSTSFVKIMTHPMSGPQMSPILKINYAMYLISFISFTKHISRFLLGGGCSERTRPVTLKWGELPYLLSCLQSSPTPFYFLILHSSAQVLYTLWKLLGWF